MKLRKIFYTAISSTLLAALSTCIYPEVSKVEIYAAEYSDNWKLNSDNNWEYYKNGNKLISTWVQDNNNWYLFDKDGVMRVGLYESYGKYYLLDDVRGTGTYGKLLKNGATYKGINISADTSSEYEGALSEDTLNRLSGVGLSKNSAANVSGTAHNTNDVNKQQAKGVWDLSQYSAFSDGKFPPKLITKREGGNIIVNIYQDGKYYLIGNDGKKYQQEAKRLIPFRFFSSGEEFLASDWAKYLDTREVAPDGCTYRSEVFDGKHLIVVTDTEYEEIGGASFGPLAVYLPYTGRWDR
jgi:putative brachyurin